MSEWKPIDTAPKDGSDILVCQSPDQDWEGEGMLAVVNWEPDADMFKDGKPGFAMWWKGDEGYCCRADWATHWMPIPELPAT